ncbi:thiol:disulfide interchange protein DsbA/DsbL [Nitrosospira sp. Nsp13]|uniref:thiol:disulfide interchange protein DsbA/DsbL n=1 Tax=Nitrosospira sp. Nsp13 TaxID=1855332 RepID=UPI000881070B|nr:thiol:disulfide interchange protein DsbA/DsbL [Nitrosospira sp. Nsp13]SCY26961.1 thiol:disulfide interchange protein DsbA [Nitrosospira sp. Nsp13]
MNSMRLFAAVLLLIGMGITGISSVRAELVEGRDYTVLTQPQPTDSGKNIEVLEFFWYGCPHCYALHPHISAWLKRIPKDVSFRYVPAIFRINWTPGAKTFYALEALGARDRLHDKVYDAIHIGKIDLTKDEVLFDWVAKQGIDRQKFIDAYNSFSVQNQQVPQSVRMSKEYQLTGVPALVVDGKYLTSGRMGGTPEDVIKILDELIEKVRKEKTKK